MKKLLAVGVFVLMLFVFFNSADVMADPDFPSCARVFTYQSLTDEGDDSYEVSLWLQSLGWGDFYELQDFATEPNQIQDDFLKAILQTEGPFDDNDLFMIKVDATLDTVVYTDTIQSLYDSGAWVVIIGDSYAQLGDEGADRIDALPTSWVVDRNYTVLSEPNSDYWLGAWNNPQWFRGIRSIHGTVAGANINAGNAWSVGSQSATVVMRPTLDSDGRQLAIILEEGDAPWRLYMSASGVGDQAVWHYGNGSPGDLWQQQVLWTCGSTKGKPTSLAIVSFEARSDASPLGTAVFLIVLFLLLATLVYLYKRK